MGRLGISVTFFGMTGDEEVGGGGGGGRRGCDKEAERIRDVGSNDEEGEEEEGGTGGNGLEDVTGPGEGGLGIGLAEYLFRSLPESWCKGTMIRIETTSNIKHQRERERERTHSWKKTRQQRRERQRQSIGLMLGLRLRPWRLKDSSRQWKTFR